MVFTASAQGRAYEDASSDFYIERERHILIYTSIGDFGELLYKAFYAKLYPRKANYPTGELAPTPYNFDFELHTLANTVSSKDHGQAFQSLFSVLDVAIFTIFFAFFGGVAKQFTARGFAAAGRLAALGVGDSSARLFNRFAPDPLLSRQK